MLRTTLRIAALGLAVTAMSSCGAIKTARHQVGGQHALGGRHGRHVSRRSRTGGRCAAVLAPAERVAPRVGPEARAPADGHLRPVHRYSVGFLQVDAEAAQFDDYERSKPLSGRALRLALRGRGYCWRALEIRFPGVSSRLTADPATAVPQARRRATYRCSTGRRRRLARRCRSAVSIARTCSSTGRSSGPSPSGRWPLTAPGAAGPCTS